MSSFAHPFDDPRAYATAGDLGRLLARGEIGWDGCSWWAHDRARAHVAKAKRGDALGFGTRLCHAVTDAAATWERARGVTRQTISRAVQPLLESGAHRSRIMAEAHNLNEDAGFPLTEAEVGQTVVNEVSWAVRKGSLRVAC